MGRNECICPRDNAFDSGRTGYREDCPEHGRDRPGQCVPAQSVVAEAMLADAVRTDPPAPPRLPTDSAERKRTPLCTGLLDYFPASLSALADHIAGIGCVPEPCGDLIEALRDRNWGEVCVLALCDLDAELAANPEDCGDLNNVMSLGDLFTEFAGALAAVAQVSWHGNEKHNPGQPLHHARGKSMDHEDCIARHHVERGGLDGPMRHSACKLWRALAAWQEQLEAGGAPRARGARCEMSANPQAGFTLADAAQANVAKLRARYPNGFVKGGGVREGVPDTEPDAWYAAELERLRERGPA